MTAKNTRNSKKIVKPQTGTAHEIAPKKRGRPSSFTSEAAARICSLVASGLSLKKTCEKMKIEMSVVYDWLARNENFCQNYARAREQRAELIFEDVAELEQKMLNGEIGHNEFRACVDSRKWFLARMAPKKYGDTSKIEVSGSLDIAAELKRRLNGDGNEQ